MKIERIKKNHKKQIIIGGLIALCLISTITITTSKAKYKLTENTELAKGTINYKPYDFKVMAMYKSDDKTNYTEINEMPSSGYIINEAKSYCATDNKTKVKGKLKTENGVHNFYNLKKSDKCYIYFDKIKITNSSDIIANSKINIGSPDFSKISTTDEGIYQASDGMYGGVSYYWRGATTTNHLIFANKCWRIVRINGDGSIRLIYNGTVKSGNTCTGNGANSEAVIMGSSESDRYYATSDGQYNKSYYVGWTYVEGKQRPETGDTEVDSNAKTKTEAWYNSNLASYSDKIADGKFCNDRNTGAKYSGWDGTWSTTWSTTGTQFAYAAVDRVWNKYQPTLACNASDVYTLKVGAITADEVELAGGKNENNTSYYMYTGQNYWIMSPCIWDRAWAYVFVVNLYGYLDNNGVHGSYGLRPVINLKSDTTFLNGNGTLDNPYIVS